jgi:hypothetical protein
MRVPDGHCGGGAVRGALDTRGGVMLRAGLFILCAWAVLCVLDAALDTVVVSRACLVDERTLVQDDELCRQAVARVIDR